MARKLEVQEDIENQEEKQEAKVEVPEEPKVNVISTDQYIINLLIMILEKLDKLDEKIK